MPVSPRLRKSPSVTIPTNSPFRSTTGNPLILYWSISLAASPTEDSGVTVITFVVITSAAFMLFTFLSRYFSRLGGSPASLPTIFLPPPIFRPLPTPPALGSDTCVI